MYKTKYRMDNYVQNERVCVCVCVICLFSDFFFLISGF